MTLASEPTAARTLVLLAEPGAGRVRRLSIALEGLGVRPPQEAEDADDADEPAPPTGPAIETVHEHVLDAAVVRPDDARPQAWPDIAAAVAPEHEAAIADWLDRHLAEATTLLATDRRLHWLLPEWLRACAERDVQARVVVAVRRPDLSADPQIGAPAGGRPADLTRAAAWLNQVLFTERATRGVPTVVVPAAEVVDDWVTATARIGEALDLEVIRDASATTVRNTQLALDRAPATTVEPNERVALPPRLAELVERVWSLLERRAAAAADGAALEAAFDEARAEYVAYYGEAEGVARSSVRAARARRVAKEAAAPPPKPPPSHGVRLPWRRKADAG